MTSSALRAALVAAVLLGGGASCTPAGDGGVGTVLVVANVDVTPGISDVIIGTTRQLSAAPKTASGIAVAGRAVSWSSTDPATASVSSSGLVTGAALGGPVRIRATVDGVNGDALVTIKAVPVDRVTVSPPSASVLVAGTAQFTAMALDAAGAPLLGRSFLWESSEPLIAAVTTTGLVIGISQGGPVTITATSEGKSGAATASVSTRPATRLAFAQQPGPSTAGSPLNPQIRIALQDILLETVLGATNPVTIALAGNPGGAVLSGTTTVNGINGVATFGDLTLDRVGASYTFLVTSPGLASATSNPFNVSAGSANRLAITQQPSANALSGVTLGVQPRLQLQDGAGNPVPTTPGLPVTATIASGVGSLGGTVTVTTNPQGIALFSNLAISGTAGSFTLRFGVPSVASVTSAPIGLAAGAKAVLAITQQPASGAQSGTALSQQPVVQLRDAAGNTVAEGGVQVTVALASGTGTLAGSTTALTNAAGAAIFSISINGPPGGYTLGFSSPGLTPASSGTITLGAGAPTRLAITTQPSPNAVNGVALPQQPAVQLRDASNNPVAQAGVGIAATVSAGGALVGIVTVNTDAAGTATFSGLAVQGPTGIYTLTFAAPGTTPAISNSIALAAGAPALLTITTQPTAAPLSGVAFPQQPVIRVRDISNNVAPQAGIVVSAVIASGPAGAALGGTVTATTDGSGVAMFATLALTGTTGAYTLRFTTSAPVLTPVVSAAVTLGAGGATGIAANSAVSQSAVAGSSVAAPPSVLVTDAASNPVANVAVTFTVTQGGGSTLPAQVAVVSTNGLGIAALTTWTLGPTAGTNNNVISATTGALAPVGFTASGLVGPAAIIGANSSVSQSATVSNPVAAPPAVLVTDANNNPAPNVPVTFTVTLGGGASVPASPATVNTNAVGVATLTSWTLGATAGTNNNTVTATAMVPSGSPVLFTASGNAAAAGNMAAASPTSLSAVVNTAVATPPSVLVTDAASNPVGNVAVTFTVTLGGGSTVPAQLAVVNTNPSGIASLAGWTIGTVAGANSDAVIASATGLPSVTFTASGSAGAADQVTANSPLLQSAQVGTAVGAPPAVLIRDQFGNPVSGFAVSFAVVSAGGGSVVPAAPASVPTDVNGVAAASGWTLGPSAGTNTVRATAAVPIGSPIDFVATGTAGSATNIAANSVTAQSGVAGSAVANSPSVRVTDNIGNPVQGIPVTFAVTLGGGSVGAPATVTTDVNGIATATSWTLDPLVGTNNNTLTATSGTLIGSPVTFTASGVAGPAALITAQSAVNQSATVATAVTAPSVKVTDLNGNVVASFAVTFTVTAAGTGGTIAPASPASVPTDALGIATLGGWTLGTAAGTNNNTVVASGVGTPVTFNASGTADLAANLAANSVVTQSADAGTAVAAPPSVKVTDSHGNPVLGTAVTFTLSTGGSINPASPATISTDASGIASLTNWVLDPTAGNANTVTATSGTLIGSPVSFSGTGTVGPATTLTANSAITQSATVATAAVAPSVLVTDAHGNPVPGFAVTFTVTAAGTGGTIAPASPASVPTDGLGIATLGSWTLGTAAGTNNNTVVASGVGTPVTFNASGTADLATNLAANSVVTQSADAGTAVAAPPSVKVTDSHGNPVLGTAVTFTLSTGGSISPASPATISTDATGLATLSTWTLDPTAGNANTLTATSGTLIGSPVTFTASGVAGPAALITAQSAVNQSATVATAVTAPSVKVTDINGNVVASFAVTFTVTAAGTGGTIAPASPASVPTDALGIATLGGWTLGTAAGTNNNTVVASGVGTPVTFNASGTAGLAAAIAAASTISQSATVGTAVATPPSVLVLDANNNPVQGTAVTFDVTAGGGSVAPAGPATVLTDVNGVATATSWTVGTAAGSNNNSVTATSAGLVGSPVSFTASGTAGAATQLTYSTQPAAPNNGAAFGAQPALLLRDVFDNPVGGQIVTATITGGPAGVALFGTPTATTDPVTGIATFGDLGLTGTAGTYSLTFTANSGALSSVASDNLILGPGAAHHLSITTEPLAAAVTGLTLPQSPVIQLRDASDNAVATSGVAVTAEIHSGTGTLGTTVTVITDGNGVVTFSDLNLTPGGSYVLRFTAVPAGLLQVISTITILVTP